MNSVPVTVYVCVLERILMLGKVEGRSRRGRWRIRWLNGITDSMDMSEQTLGDGEEQGSLACCSPWGCEESDMTERLNSCVCVCTISSLFMDI